MTHGFARCALTRQTVNEREYPGFATGMLPCSDVTRRIARIGPSERLGEPTAPIPSHRGISLTTQRKVRERSLRTRFPRRRQWHRFAFELSEIDSRALPICSR
jgi:hypothetical protein